MGMRLIKLRKATLILIIYVGPRSYPYEVISTTIQSTSWGVIKQYFTTGHWWELTPQWPENRPFRKFHCHHTLSSHATTCCLLPWTLRLVLIRRRESPLMRTVSPWSMPVIIILHSVSEHLALAWTLQHSRLLYCLVSTGILMLTFRVWPADQWSCSSWKSHDYNDSDVHSLDHLKKPTPNE